MVLVMFDPTSVTSSVGTAAVMKSSSLTKLEDDLANATAQREAAEKSLKGAESSYADALSKKQALDSKIYALDVEIEAIEALVNEIGVQIAQKDSQIAEENGKLTAQYENVRLRIRAKHEDGGVDYLAIFLEADGLSDLFSRIDRYVSML